MSKVNAASERKKNNGNWEFNDNKSRDGVNGEANIKQQLRPTDFFDPTQVHDYINKQKSKEEIIEEKFERGEPLNKKEQFILENSKQKKQQEKEKDIKLIEDLSIKAQPKTNYGKTLLLLEILKKALEDNNTRTIINIYLKLKEPRFFITEDLNETFRIQLDQMTEIIKTQDIIKLQFTEFHSQMPPLNQKGFTKLDPWQIQVIQNIDNNISMIVNVPTSGGKTILSSYTITKGRVLYVLPTNALVWQVASLLGKILDCNIPILTDTHQTIQTRDEMIELLNSSRIIVGTPEIIVNYLPMMKINFDWLIFDEIHMIGKPEACAMEYILKIIPHVPFLALSATIGNAEEIVSWLSQITSQKIQSIICEKRFFNLQRFYYNDQSNKLQSIHPLALIEEHEFFDKSILTKTLQPTPPTIWDLAEKLMEKYDLGELSPYIYFNTDDIIELNQTIEWFQKLLVFMTDKKDIMSIINTYKHSELQSENIDIVKLIFKLKEEEKLPAIIFQNETIACLDVVRQVAKQIEHLEDTKFPKLIQDRLRLQKLNKKSQEKSQAEEVSPKKELKQLLGTTKALKQKYGDKVISKPVIEEDKYIPLQEPHPDFIVNQIQYFSEDIIEKYVSDLKKYFPNIGDYYHFIIKLLWRGIGVYVAGLPEPYLRLVQILACQKKLAIVFSDSSLVFGVSMPFRTSVILNSDIDAMLYHQMSGRAGRRGLDKEGNVIFAGFSWSRIKELSISSAPNITGLSRDIYTISHANKISELFKTDQDWSKLLLYNLDKSISIDYSSKYYIEWPFGYIESDFNHLYMNWMLRHSQDCVIASLIIPYLKRAFDLKDPLQEKVQIEMAHFICNFINVKSTDDVKNKLEKLNILLESPYNNIFTKLTNAGIILPENIDNRIYKSIQLNNLIEISDALRYDLNVFSIKLKHIQHFCFHSKLTTICKIMGKLLTRIWWIYHMSSPIMKPYYVFEEA